MPSRADNGVGDAVRSVSDHAVALARLEVRLAKEELRGKASQLGAGAALGLGGVVLALFGVGYALAAASAGLDRVLPSWLAHLVVALLVLVSAVVLVLFARKAVRDAAPPVPERAIEEAEATKRMLRQRDAA